MLFKKINGLIKKSKSKSENTPRQMKIKTQLSKTMLCSKSSSKREVLQAYLKKQEKSQINNLTYYLKELEKEEKAQSQQREGNNKDQSGNKKK